MPNYVALIYTPDVDWSRPEYSGDMADSREFGEAAVSVIRGGAVLYQTNTATTVRVSGGKGGDLDEAISVASRIPAAWNGAVEVCPVLPMEAPIPESVDTQRADVRSTSVTT